MKRILAAIFCVLICVLIVASATCAQAQSTESGRRVNQTPDASRPLPSLTGFVNDLAKAIDEKSRVKLEHTLAELHRKNQMTFAVVTIETTGEETIFDYSLRLARSRQLDDEKPNKNSALLVIAVQDRRWRIQITDSLESYLSEEFLKDAAKPMTNLFQRHEYGEGISVYVSSVVEELKRQQIIK